MRRSIKEARGILYQISTGVCVDPIGQMISGGVRRWSSPRAADVQVIGDK